jgi:hypothetical protein
VRTGLVGVSLFAFVLAACTSEDTIYGTPIPLEGSVDRADPGPPPANDPPPIVGDPGPCASRMSSDGSCGDAATALDATVIGEATDAVDERDARDVVDAADVADALDATRAPAE